MLWSSERHGGVKTALMNIMVFTIGLKHRGRYGCTGENRKTKLAREGRIQRGDTALYSRFPSGVLYI